MTEAKRITWIDAMKAFSMLAVVLYHTNIMPEVKTMAYILCLPAFFFCGGFFADATMSADTYFRKKTLRLLIPYLIFSLLAWVAWLFVGRNYGADADAQTAWYEPLWGTLVGTSYSLFHNAPLWFLTCFMVLEWLWFALMRSRMAWWGQIIVMVVLAGAGITLGRFHILLPWGLTAAMTMLPIYWLGKTLFPILKDRSSGLPVWKILLLLFAGVVGAGVAFYYNPDIKISTAQVGNPFLFYVGELGVIALWFALAALCDRLHLSKATSLIGTQTLWLLGLHLPFFGAVKGAALLLHVPLSFFDTTAGCLTLWLATFLILLPCIYGIKFLYKRCTYRFISRSSSRLSSRSRMD